MTLRYRRVNVGEWLGVDNGFTFNNELQAMTAIACPEQVFASVYLKDRKAWCYAYRRSPTTMATRVHHIVYWPDEDAGPEVNEWGEVGL